MTHQRPRALLCAADLSDRQVVARAIGSDFVEVAANAEALLRKVSAGTAYDLVIFDLELSLQEGWPSGRHLHDAIASSYSQSSPLLVLFTADPDEEEAYSIAGISVLTKPLSAEEMASVLALAAIEATERKAS